MGPPLGAPPAQPPVLGTILRPIPEVAGDAEGVLGRRRPASFATLPQTGPLRCCLGPSPVLRGQHRRWSRGYAPPSWRLVFRHKGGGLFGHYQQHYSNCTPFYFSVNRWTDGPPAEPEGCHQSIQELAVSAAPTRRPASGCGTSMVSLPGR